MGSRIVVARGCKGWRKNGRLMFNGYRVSVWRDEKVLETDSGDGCSTMWMYLVPLNCTLEMVKMVNFMLYTLYYNLFYTRSVVKNPLANARDAGDTGSIPGSGRSPGEGNGNPFVLGNPMDREAWWATVYGVTKSQTWLSDWTTTARVLCVKKVGKPLIKFNPSFYIWEIFCFF